MCAYRNQIQNQNQDDQAIHDIANLLLGLGDRFSGGPDGVYATAQLWHHYGFNAAMVDSWTSVGVWNPDTADEWHFSCGTTPQDIVDAANRIATDVEVDAVLADPIESACRGDLEPSLLAAIATGIPEMWQLVTIEGVETISEIRQIKLEDRVISVVIERGYANDRASIPVYRWAVHDPSGAADFHGPWHTSLSAAEDGGQEYIADLIE